MRANGVLVESLAERIGQSFGVIRFGADHLGAQMGTSFHPEIHRVEIN